MELFSFTIIVFVTSSFFLFREITIVVQHSTDLEVTTLDVINHPLFSFIESRLHHVLHRNRRVFSGARVRDRGVQTGLQQHAGGYIPEDRRKR